MKRSPESVISGLKLADRARTSRHAPPQLARFIRKSFEAEVVISSRPVATTGKASTTTTSES
jgi:hypothetical protein